MSNAAIEQMIADRVAATLAAKRTATNVEVAKVAIYAAAAETTRAAATACGARGSNNAGPTAGAGGPNVAGPTVGAIAMNAELWDEPAGLKDRSQCFFISKCAENDKVKYATSTLLDEALSCWNSIAQPIGIENAYKIPWGVDKTTYNRQFQELAILCPAMVPTIEKLLERYVWELLQPIQGNVTSFDPATIDEAMRMARRLMDQAVRAGTVLENAQGYAIAEAAPAGGRGYAGNLPVMQP
ncbi:hypothetical protein Tco_0691359, partial [Tanacetum coccineum]